MDITLVSQQKISIPVQETFQQTIQGEGYWVGTPVDFIRLHGCPVMCPWCDQEYSNGGGHLPRSLQCIDKLISELKSPRVVISGGEPFIHKHLPQLAQAILDSKREVSIETSGAFYQPVSSFCWITLSPKEHLNPKYPVCDRLLKMVNEIKIVISDGAELNYYRENLFKKSSCHRIYLQPEWTQRDRTIPLTLNLLKEYPTARLSLQTHKYIGVL